MEAGFETQHSQEWLWPRLKQRGRQSVIVSIVRVTVNLPEDVFRAARSLADRKDISLGDALAELTRAGLRPVPFPSFDVSASAKAIKLEHTLEVEDGL